MRTRVNHRVTQVAATCMLLLTTQPLAAQDVQYRTVSKLDMGMGINLALRLAGAAEVSQTSYIKGRKMRTDADKSSSIYDLDRSRVIVINNADRTYITAPLAQMMAAFNEMAASTNARADAGQMKATARDSAGNKADFTFNVTMEPTSERDNVNGQDAQRAFATIETDVKVTPEGEARATDAGTLVILVDSWNANGGAAYTAVHNFQQAMSKELRDQTFSSAKGFSAAFAQNPQMGEALRKADAEQRKMDGIAVRSTIYLVAVPPSLRFDRDAAIRPQDSNAATAASAAKRALGGMIGGALRRGRQEDKAEPAQPRQATIMKMTTEIQDVQTASLSASLFDAPAGYREIPFRPAPRK
ncbi:MAG: hypothetical protein ABJA80_11020 [bacterium]